MVGLATGQRDDLWKWKVLKWNLARMEIRRGLVPSAGTTTNVDPNLISTSTFDQQAMPSTALSCRSVELRCVLQNRAGEEANESGAGGKIQS